MPDFDKLSENVNKLKSLLDDRQEGLHTWCTFVESSWKKIAEMWNGPADLPDANKLANHQEGVCGTCGKWVVDCKCRRR